MALNEPQKKIAKQARAGCLALKLQGDVAGLTTYTTRRGRIVYFLQAPPNQPVSVDQAYFRSIFKSAIESWKQLRPAQQQQWYKACRSGKLRLGPTALIVAACMPGNASTMRTLQRQTNTQLINGDGSIVQ